MLQSRALLIPIWTLASLLECALATAGPLGINPGVNPSLAAPINATLANVSTSLDGVQHPQLGDALPTNAALMASYASVDRLQSQGRSTRKDSGLVRGVLSEGRIGGASVIVLTLITADSDLIGYVIDPATAAALGGSDATRAIASGGSVLVPAAMVSSLRRSAVNSLAMEGPTAIVEGADGQIMLVHEVVDAVVALLFGHREPPPEETQANYRPPTESDYAAANDVRGAVDDGDTSDEGLIKRRTKRSTAAECK